MQVFDEGADALIEDREILGFPQEDGVIGPPLGILAAVPVPLAVIQRDDAGPGFNQTPGEQEALRHARGAVPVHEDLGVAGPVTGHVRGSSRERSRASASLEEVSSPIACSVKASRPVIIAD